jgi:AcrR family transcriptional regulator
VLWFAIIDEYMAGMPAARLSMTTHQRVKKHAERAPKARVDKFSERRAELGEAALTTLAALGYARTSLREIAQNSEFSHGVLHYYFSDKVDLIICSVKQYKARCVTRYDHAVESATTCDELMEGFLQSLGDTLRDEGHVHRLWYDLRSQALFEEAFRADVVQIDKSLEDMIWRIMSRFAELRASRAACRPRPPTRCSTGCSSRRCSSTCRAMRRPSRQCRPMCARPSRGCSPRPPGQPPRPQSGASAAPDAHRRGLRLRRFGLSSLSLRRPTTRAPAHCPLSHSSRITSPISAHTARLALVVGRCTDTHSPSVRNIEGESMRCATSRPSCTSRCASPKGMMVGPSPASTAAFSV